MLALGQQSPLALLNGRMTARPSPICFWNARALRDPKAQPYIDPELQKGTTPLADGVVVRVRPAGLETTELAASNFRFTIPQASSQPSYNLAAAVLVTLFELFRRRRAGRVPAPAAPGRPLPFSEQDACLGLILRKLKDRRFIHPTNARHAGEMVRDLLGRLAITAADRRLLLAMFSHAGPGPED